MNPSMKNTPGPADWGVVGEHLVDPNYLDDAGASDGTATGAAPLGARFGAGAGRASGFAGGDRAGEAEVHHKDGSGAGSARRATRAGSFAEWHGLLPRPNATLKAYPAAGAGARGAASAPVVAKVEVHTLQNLLHGVLRRVTNLFPFGNSLLQ